MGHGALWALSSAHSLSTKPVRWFKVSPRNKDVGSLGLSANSVPKVTECPSTARKMFPKSQDVSAHLRTPFPKLWGVSAKLQTLTKIR